MDRIIYTRGGFTIKILEKLTKQIEFSKTEEQQIDAISYILLLLVVAVLPLIFIPKVVNTPVNTWYFLDFTGYYKLIFLIVISMFMITIMGFKAIARKQHIKLSLPLVLFTLWMLLALFFAEDPAIAFTGYPLRWQGFLAYFCYGIVFTFAVNMLKHKYFGKILVALSISVGICAIHSLFNYYGYEPFNLILKYLLRLKIIPDVSRGTLGNRNTAGAYFVIPTIISFIMFLKNKEIRKNIFYYIVLVLSYGGLLVSLTRVAWMGTIGAMVFSIWFFRKDIKKNIRKLTLVVVTFVVILFVLDFTGNGQIIGRYYSMKNQIERASNGEVEQLGSSRFFIYKKAFKVIAQNPIVGVGPDCFAYYAVLTKEDYRQHPELSGVGYFDKVHSEYLEYAATSGIPALIFYLWFILSIFVPWLRKKGDMKPEMLAVFLGLTGYLMQAAFNFGAISVLPVFFVLLGLLRNGLINENDQENLAEINNEENAIETACNELTEGNAEERCSLT
ncbi:MAG: O-Antigen ligase [Firmicutes bacterium ADurb.Bin419]|nr:MAG: O-Antigen ligase [Firmicutes bacterium ADurb.Bin419]